MLKLVLVLLSSPFLVSCSNYNVNLTLTEKAIPGVCINTNNTCIVDFGSLQISFANWNKTFNATLADSELYIFIHESDGFNLSKFLCSLNNPVCINASMSSAEPLIKLVAPCRSLCRRAAEYYNDGLRNFDGTRLSRSMPWPYDCNQFPRPKDVHNMCVPPTP